MKKIKYFIFLFMVLILPLGVFAEVKADKEIDRNSNEVFVYLFRGEGCPHCIEAEEWFKTIENKYGSKFQLVSYETWNNSDNAKLLEKVARVRGEDVGGVPYIVVGNQSWTGFTSDYSDDIIKKIESEFDLEKEKRYDVMNYLNTIPEDNNKVDTASIVTLLVVAGVLSLISFGIYNIRKKH